MKFYNEWTMERILEFINQHLDNHRTCIDDNGYVHYFSDGSTFECKFSSWKNETPTKYYINGELVYSGSEY